MNKRRTIWLKLRSLWQRPAVKREIDEELRFHLEQRTAENMAAGMPPEEAAREARKRFGNLQSVREDCRAVFGASLGEATLRDIRFGLRMLRRSPGFTVVAILTLALCIGANLAIFAVVDAILVRPLPFREAGRLMTVFNSYPKAGLGLRLLFVGTILGVCGAWIAGRAMQSLLSNVPPLHLATFVGTALIMGVVSLVACLLPARRASRVDPMEILRHE